MPVEARAMKERGIKGVRLNRFYRLTSGELPAASF
ncbi:hypothetical protein ES703_92265 [subsurface metagenome]